MAVHFVFSPDEMFDDQRAALAAAGFGVSECSDAVPAGARALRDVPPGSTVVYRGWMLNAREYVNLVAAIEACGATPLTSPREYLLAHHLPNWYPLLAEFTPETRTFATDADIVAELRALDWGLYFVKDYVKALKTGRGPILHDPAEAPELLALMREYRGTIEGGVCVRRVEEFVPDTERRYFVLNGAPFGPDPNEPVPDIVRACAERVPCPFFSVDVARRTDGALRIVEIGDGQVSDLVGWTVARFAVVCAATLRRAA
jgi:hypothetical protein